MKSQLRFTKESAYGVELVLEDRMEFLGSSPQAVAWDAHGNRLLYHRSEWYYRVIQGTGTIYDWGRVETLVCALGAAKLPLHDLAQGEVVARVAVDVVSASPGFAGPREIEMIAADPDSGNFVVYSHATDGELPIVLKLAAFSPAGSVLSSGSAPQPVDDSPPWIVPHAIAANGRGYSIERDTTAWPDSGPASGRVVWRGFGTVGSQAFAWSPGDRYIFLHSLAADPGNSLLWVFGTRLEDPGLPTNRQRSYCFELDLEDLGFRGYSEINFGFEEYSYPSVQPYRLGSWEAAGGPNTGGLCAFAGRDAGAPAFYSAYLTPSGYNPDPAEPRPSALFRWALRGSGEHLADLGDPLPIPLHSKPGGLLGAWYGSFPESVDTP